ELLQATSSTREARLAFVAFEGMDPSSAAARYPTHRAALELVGSYAAALPLWKALEALPPEEGQKRLAALHGLSDLKDRVGVDGLGRLVAGQLAAPLDSKGLEAVTTLVGEQSALSWKPEGAGWTQELVPRTGRVWRYQATGEAKDVTTCLESGEFQLPPDGECFLSLDASWNLSPPDKSGFVVEALDGQRWAQVLSLQGTGQGQDVKPVSLLYFAGKKVRFRVRRWVNEGPGQGDLTLRGLRLEETRTGPVQQLDAANWAESTTGYSHKTQTWTSDWLQLDSSPSELRLSIFYALRSTRNDLYVDILTASDPNWKQLSHFWSKEYKSDSRELDLAAYAGQKVRLRYRIEAGEPGTRSWEQPTLTRYTAYLVPRRSDQTGALRKRLFAAGGLDGAQAEEVFRQAFDASSDASQRSRTVQAMARLHEALGDFEAARRAWACLEKHLSEPDFEDRLGAAVVLARGGQASPEEMERALLELERVRQSGQQLAHVAVLQAARSPEDFLTLQRRLSAESPPGKLAEATALLAGVQALTDARTTDEVWNEVSVPVLDEDLSQRARVFQELTRALGDNPGHALAVWRKLTS
ncbi:MAG: hypothetical protein AB1758_36280, partial [Candidatus Eremiobacterota bacterium]